MKDRTFKLVFLVTSAVCLLCTLILAVLLHSAEPQLRLVEMSRSTVPLRSVMVPQPMLLLL